MDVQMDHFPTMIPPAMRRIQRYAPPVYNMLMALIWKYCTRHPFAATDAKYLLLNCEALYCMQDEWQDPVGNTAFLLVHEGWHAINNHPYRLSPKKAPDRERAQMAADYVTNHAIHDMNLKAGKVCGGSYPFPFIEGALFDPELTDNKSVEETYHLLWTPNAGGRTQDPPKKRNEQDTNPGDQPGSGGQSKGDDKSNNGDSRGGGDGDGDKEGGLTDGGGGNGGKGDAGETGQGSSGQAGNSKGGSSDQDGSGASDEAAPRGEFPGTGSPDMLQPQTEEGKTPEEIEREISQQTSRVILNQQLNEQAGIGGDGFGRMIAKDQNNPVTDWKQYLKKWLLARAASGWNRPFNAPIYSSTGLVCAGRETNIIDELIIGVDVSGSITDDKIANMFSHIVSGLQEVQFNTAHLLLCDYFIRKTITVEANDVDSFPTHFTDGGGGTALQPYFDWQTQHAPDAPMIILTDGHSSDRKELIEPGPPVLWLSWGIDPEWYPFGDAVKVWQ